MKSVTIESCTEGYLVKDSNTSKIYAVSKEKLVQKVKELLGITEKKIKNPIDKLDILLEKYKLSSRSDIAKGLEQAINQSSTFTFSEIPVFEASVQPKTAGKTIYWLHPDGEKIRISRVGYKSIFVHTQIGDLKYLYNHPGGQKETLVAFGKATYENKAIILRGFLKDVPLSSLVEEPQGHEDGCCDDVAFESCANNSPDICKLCVDQSKYEEKNKNN